MSETQPETFDETPPGSRRSVTGTAEQPPPGITAWPEREKPAQPLNVDETGWQLHLARKALDGRPFTAPEVFPETLAVVVDHAIALVAEVKRLRDEADHWHGVATKAKDQRDQAERERDHARREWRGHNKRADEFRAELARTEGDLAVTVAEASRTREALREMRAFVPLIQKASVRTARDRFASAALRLVDAALRGPADREGGSADV